MPSTQTTITLSKRPTGNVSPDTFNINKNEKIPTKADLKPGELLVKVLYISVDPAMRGWLNDARSYLPPVKIGEVMRAGGLGRVVASRSDKFKEGDLVDTMTGWQEWAIVPTKGTTKITIPKGAELSDFLSVLGMTGQTAYWGFFDVGKPKKTDTVLVNGAAGAVGMVVCQLALLHGCRVIAVAGGKEKCDFLKNELGVHEALDYKSKSYKKDFYKATEGFLDVVFENVGGELLDLSLGRLNKGARIVLCGAISSYNAEGKPPGLANYAAIIGMRAIMSGYIVFDYTHRFPESSAKLAQWLSEGTLKRRETKLQGIESCIPGLIGLFEGKNLGKMIIELPDSKERL